MVINDQGNVTVPIKYTQSPISQVICEFRFTPSAEWDITLAGLLFGELKDQFPIKRPFKAMLAQSPGLNIEAAFNELVQFVQTDEKALVQVGPNFLSIIHNPPYPGWEQFLPLILKTLDAYVKTASPSGLQRIGLRYINRIVFQDPSIVLSDWFKYNLQMPSGLAKPAPMANFLAVSNFLLEDNRDLLTLQLGSATVSENEGAACLLDIDYAITIPQSVTLDRVPEWLEQAHLTVENFFEASIQDTLREQFKPL